MLDTCQRFYGFTRTALAAATAHGGADDSCQEGVGCSTRKIGQTPALASSPPRSHRPSPGGDRWPAARPPPAEEQTLNRGRIREGPRAHVADGSGGIHREYPPYAAQCLAASMNYGAAYALPPTIESRLLAAGRAAAGTLVTS